MQSSTRGRFLALFARNIAAAAAVVVVLVVAGRGTLGADGDKARTLSLYNIHTKETLSVVYKRNGKHVPEAMKQIDWILRDWRRDESTKMDPELIDLIWEVHNELGSREPVHIISGFRSRATNENLRKTVGGQASESRHILGQAADVHFPDVSVKQIRYSALIRERGGVGYYPTSAIPFVHIDTSRVRAWPRLPRQELALLFPSGRTQHVPLDGEPITPADVKLAREQNKALVGQIAEFHDVRKGAKPPVLIASASGTAPAVDTAWRAQIAALDTSATAPLAPQLLTEPKLVDRPVPLSTRPTDEERLRLALLTAPDSAPRLVGAPRPVSRRGNTSFAVASLGPDALGRLIDRETVTAALPPLAPLPEAETDEASEADGRFTWGIAYAQSTAWAQAPDWDEDHPEELSYRPFPISPYLTATASPDDPALARLHHPDVARTFDLLDQAGAMPPMRLRPGQQVAQLLWAQQFKVANTSIEDLAAEPVGQPVPLGLANRAVRTSTN